MDGEIGKGDGTMKFIEVTENDKKYFINVNKILFINKHFSRADEESYRDQDGNDQTRLIWEEGTRIVLDALDSDNYDRVMFKVDEKYEDIKKTIEGMEQ